MLGLQFLAAAEIGPVWLTHRTNDPAKLCVNWLTSEATNSVVRLGFTRETTDSVKADELVAVHHVEIPFGEGNDTLYYVIESGPDRTQIGSVRRYGGDEFRAAVVADWQGKAACWIEAIGRGGTTESSRSPLPEAATPMLPERPSKIAGK